MSAALVTMATVVGIVWTILNIRDKLRPAKPHPLAPTLDARLADIAAAIREGRAA